MSTCLLSYACHMYTHAHIAPSFKLVLVGLLAAVFASLSLHSCLPLHLFPIFAVY